MRAAILFVGLVAACTKPNPAVMCTDSGTCTDPAFPFCDVDGSKGGEPGTCISVMCNAGDFGGCRGSDALICDATGETFDPMACQNGCDPTTGCITCTPSTQSCANDMVTSCDANGLLGTQACALGCSTDGTRCADIDPSNNLGMFYDMTPTPADLDLENGTLELDGSTFDDGTNQTPIPGFLVPGSAGAAPIRVIVVKNLTLGDITITSSSAAPVASGGVGPAIAFLATGDINVTGRVALESGAVDVAGCTGEIDQSVTVTGGVPPALHRHNSGAGGGAFFTDGGKGGAIGGLLGGNAGKDSSNVLLVPLRGGCPGGFSDTAALGGHGGGAMQLVSRTQIVVSGTIVADGGVQRGGGGAGGGVLLEAAVVTITADAKVLVRGGGGSSTVAAPVPPDDASAPQGGSCVGPNCGAGGAGATFGQLTIQATDGADVPAADAGSNQSAGAGGGGLGVVRVNNRLGDFTPGTGAVITTDVGTSPVGTR